MNGWDRTGMDRIGMDRKGKDMSQDFTVTSLRLHSDFSLFHNFLIFK